MLRSLNNWGSLAFKVSPNTKNRHIVQGNQKQIVSESEKTINPIIYQMKRTILFNKFPKMMNVFR
jgi:hypothetical protein